jgi:hypothetical protein
MLRNLPTRNAPRVEIDQRIREARLGLERVERMLKQRPDATLPWLRRLIRLSDADARQGQTARPLIAFRPASSALSRPMSSGYPPRRR